MSQLAFSFKTKAEADAAFATLVAAFPVDEEWLRTGRTCMVYNTYLMGMPIVGLAGYVSPHSAKMYAKAILGGTQLQLPAAVSAYLSEHRQPGLGLADWESSLLRVLYQPGRGEPMFVPEVGVPYPASLSELGGQEKHE